MSIIVSVSTGYDHLLLIIYISVDLQYNGGRVRIVRSFIIVPTRVRLLPAGFQYDAS